MSRKLHSSSVDNAGEDDSNIPVPHALGKELSKDFFVNLIKGTFYPKFDRIPLSTFYTRYYKL